MKQGLAPLRGKLRLDEISQMTHRVHRLQLRRLELDPEARLHSHDQVDVVERVPFGNARRGESRRQHDRVIVEEIVEDGSELCVDILLLHAAIISA